MNKKSRSNNHKHQKVVKPETKSAGRLRFFYVLMLVMTISSLLLRVARSRQTSTAQPGNGTTARVLVFHHQGSNLCEDLVVTAAWNAVFSDCGKGAEKQYALNAAERTQLQTWIETYSAVNYGPNDTPPTGTAATQLHLNGRGSRPAANTEALQLVDFAETLASKIASQS